MKDYILPVVTSWDDWRPIFTEAAVWRPVIARLWAAAPALRARTGIAAPDRVVAGYPGTCAVFIIDVRAVIKFFPPMVAGDGAREAAVYRLLDGRVPGASLLAAGVFPDRIDWPYLVVSHVSGAAWREIGATIAPMQQEVILQTMGRAVRRVHETPLGNEGWTSSARWGEFISHSLSEIDLRLQRDTSFSPALIDDLISLLSTIDWFASRPRLLHADLTADHLLLGERGGRWAMTGLIDWADAMVGDPYYEWVALWFDLCRREARLFRAFWRGYDPAGEWQPLSTQRLLALTMLHRFGTGILNDAMPPLAQRRVAGVAALCAALFPGLPAAGEG